MRTRWKTRTEGEHGAGGGEGVAGLECRSAWISLREGEEKDTRGEAAASAVEEEEQVELAEDGEEEGRVFTHGNHMGEDGRRPETGRRQDLFVFQFWNGGEHEASRSLLSIFGSLPFWTSDFQLRGLEFEGQCSFYF
jgi:hypothetical protein